MDELHAAGLGNFNLDLMYALPGQDLAGALWPTCVPPSSCEPAHISHYQLTMEPGTVFGGRPPAGLPDDELSYDMQRACQARTRRGRLRAVRDLGLRAQRRPQCAHNLNYWHFGDYLGVGAGAHGKLTRRGRAADGANDRAHRARARAATLSRARATVGAPPTTPVVPRATCRSNS